MIINVRPCVFDICPHSGIDRQAVLTCVRTSTSYTLMWYGRCFHKKAKRKFRIEELGKRDHLLFVKQSLENIPEEVCQVLLSTSFPLFGHRASFQISDEKLC